MGGRDPSITLSLELGDNVWIVGVIDEPYLKMVKIKITADATSEWIGERYSETYSQACAQSATFTENCYLQGTARATNEYRVSLATLPGRVQHAPSGVACVPCACVVLLA